MYHFELKPARKEYRNPAQHWEKELEKFFDVFSRNNDYAPACEILDEEKSYTISLDIPGMKKENLEIEVKDNHLHISGERKSGENSEKSDVLRSERRYGKFERVFSLPQNVNADLIQARFEDGVLDITLPKEEKSQTKKISISGWKEENEAAQLKN